MVDSCTAPQYSLLSGARESFVLFKGCSVEGIGCMNVVLSMLAVRRRCATRLYSRNKTERNAFRNVYLAPYGYGEMNALALATGCLR